MFYRELIYQAVIFLVIKPMVLKKSELTLPSEMQNTPFRQGKTILTRGIVIIGCIRNVIWSSAFSIKSKLFAELLLVMISLLHRFLLSYTSLPFGFCLNNTTLLSFQIRSTYEYDLNGNLIRVIGSAQSALYEYNSENKLVKATVQNGSLVIEESYTYDYQGNRTSKTTHRSDGVTEYVKYLNDNSSLTNVLAEIDSEGSVQAYYTIGADLISQERDGKKSYYVYDGHGSVVGLANESGVVTDTYSYDAFGNLLKSTGSTKNCYRYCGEQFDETTGLYYLRARYMDTSTGRFISHDSYAGSIDDPVSLHKYLYANANPVMYSDPSGYFTLEDVEIGTAGETILNVAYQMANQSAMRIGMAILASVITIADVALFTYIITEYLLDNINNIASGATTSAEGNDEIRDKTDKEKEGESDDTDGDDESTDSPDYPGDNPNKAPGDDWEWKGKGSPDEGKGNWTNPNTGESLHPDLKHPEPYGPHWDYKSPDGKWYRIFPDGTIIPK